METPVFKDSRRVFDAHVAAKGLEARDRPLCVQWCGDSVLSVTFMLVATCILRFEVLAVVLMKIHVFCYLNLQHALSYFFPLNDSFSTELTARREKRGWLWVVGGKDTYEVVASLRHCVRISLERWRKVTKGFDDTRGSEKCNVSVISCPCTVEEP